MGDEGMLGISVFLGVAMSPLQAMVQGWGGEKLLPAYETERRPVAVRNASR